MGWPGAGRVSGIGRWLFTGLAGSGTRFGHWALIVSGLAWCWPGFGTCTVVGLTGSGTRLGHRTAFISGLAWAGGLDCWLAGSLLICRLAWGGLIAVGRARHVLTSDLGLLLFANDGRRSRCDGAGGSDGPGHGNFSWTTAVSRVELLPVLRGGLGYLALLGERSHAGLITGGELLRAGLDVDAAAATVVADAVRMRPL